MPFFLDRATGLRLAEDGGAGTGVPSSQVSSLRSGENAASECTVSGTFWRGRPLLSAETLKWISDQSAFVQWGGREEWDVLAK